MLIVKRLSLAAFCVCALCIVAFAQQNDEGRVQACTDPGVLTDDGVNLKEPVELVYADTTRCLCTLVTVVFKGADGKTLMFEFKEPLPEGNATPLGEFKVIDKCRQTEHSLEYLETTNVRAGSKEEQSLLKFLRSWLEANVPEEKRARYQHVVKGEARNEGFSGEASEIYYLYVILNKVENRNDNDSQHMPKGKH